MTVVQPLSLQIEADLTNLAPIRDFIASASLALGFDPDAVSGMILAVDEAASNAIMHGYRNGPGSLDLEVKRQNSDLIVHLRDTAPVFNPLTVAPPDTTLPPEERMLHGMGVYLMRKAVDSVTHHARPKGGNELILRKSIEA
jgi:serine/threonine-protein kinase RsbW